MLQQLVTIRFYFMAQIHAKWYAYWLASLLLGATIGFGYLALVPVKVSQPRQIPFIPIPVETPVPEIQPSHQPITLIFTGDVMLGRTVNKNIVTYNDPTWPFKNVASVLSAADITYVNLEGPLVPNCPIVESGFKFCGNLDNAKELEYAGVDVVSLANNHATNYGPEGLTSTVESLELYGIHPVGLGSPVRVERQDQTFTFHSFNDIGPYPGIQNLDPNTFAGIIARAKVEGEVLIVTFHWGNEYQATPSDRQIQFAHQAIDAGSDLVIGAHPHWVQTKEVYRGKTIYYSLGNFVFDQEWSAETKRGLVVKATYVGDQLQFTEELPILIENYGQPRWQ